MSDTVKRVTSFVTVTDDGYIQAKAGLIRKRAALIGEVEALNRQLAEKTAQIRSLAAALIVLDPEADIDGMPARRAPVQFGSFRGEMARFFLTELRNAPDGLTTKELAEALMRERHLDVGDRQATKLMQSRASHSLMKLRLKGFTRSVQNDPSGTLRWWLVGHADLQ